MSTMKTIRALGLNDLRNVRRDQLLGWMMLVPLLYGIMIRWLVPLITANIAFDLEPYYPVILGFFGLMAPILFGMVIGFLLLDERDDGTLLAMRVSPLSLGSYLFYKLFMPSVLSIFMTVAVYAIAGLMPLDLNAVLPAALVAALEAPLWALLLATFANNKVQGFALLKGGAGVFLVLPIGAYFIGYPWQMVFWIFPPYWPVKVYWQLVAGAPAWPYVLGGILFHMILLAVLLRAYRAKLARTAS